MSEGGNTMKVCSIFNEYDKIKKAVAYLIYYEKSNCFYIEIEEDADPAKLPMLLALFVEKGVYTIDSLWSKKWVNSRIIPTDRQNLGSILKHNGLEYYDEYKLLIKGKGKCSHDDYCVEELATSQIDETVVAKRFKHTIRDVVVKDEDMLVFFRDDTTRKYNLNQLVNKKEQVSYLKKNFDEYEIMPGGYEINWNDIVVIDIERLRSVGESVAVPYKYFQKFAQSNIVNTSGACEMLGCSRQNIDDMVRRNSLEPVHASAKNKMFFKQDIQKKMW